MGQRYEEAHSIALTGCENIKQLWVGGGWLVGWFILQRHRLTLNRLVDEAGFSRFWSGICRFSKEAAHGYTYVVIIGTSSINIHTYPEKKKVNVWVITCPGEDDDGSATEKLRQLLKAHFEALTNELGPFGRIPL